MLINVGGVGLPESSSVVMMEFPTPVLLLTRKLLMKNWRKVSPYVRNAHASEQTNKQ